MLWHLPSEDVQEETQRSIENSFLTQRSEQVGLQKIYDFSFAIDYDSRRIWFSDTEPMPSALPLEQNQPYLIVKANLDDIPLTLMIDTGCEDVVLFANRFPVELKKGVSPDLPGINGRGRGTGNTNPFR